METGIFRKWTEDDDVTEMHKDFIMNIYNKLLEGDEEERKKNKPPKKRKKTKKEKNIEAKLEECPQLIGLILEGHSVHATCIMARKNYGITIPTDYIGEIKKLKFDKEQLKEWKENSRKRDIENRWNQKMPERKMARDALEKKMSIKKIVKEIGLKEHLVQRVKKEMKEEKKKNDTSNELTNNSKKRKNFVNENTIVDQIIDNLTIVNKKTKSNKDGKKDEQCADINENYKDKKLSVPV